MGKQKQQIISRFFAPKSALNLHDNPPVTSDTNTNSISPAKVAITIDSNPLKRRGLQSDSSLSLSKQAKTSHDHLSSPSLHQKFIKKFLEPSSDPVPSAPTADAVSGDSKYTPLEQQVLELKSKYPDVLLMVEVGYKYRFFGNDAEVAAKELGIFAHVSHNFLTASIPSFRLDFHLRRLVGAGYKVGVVKQTETAAIKAHGANKIGPFTRGLSALYTKATLEAAAELFGAEESKPGGGGNYLMCVVETGSDEVVPNTDVRTGFVGVEISTGDVIFGELNSDSRRSELESAILSISPSEILLGEPVSVQTEKLLLAYAGPASNVRIERVSHDCFGYPKVSDARGEIMSWFERTVKGKPSLMGYPEQNAELTIHWKPSAITEEITSMPEMAVQALSLTIHYLEHFGLGRMLCLGASIRPFSHTMEMSLSANALQQLEILRNNFDGTENGSLLQAMNHTCTTFGSRLLKHWVVHPLCDGNAISARLDAVDVITKSLGQSTDLQNNADAASSGAILQPKIAQILSSVLMTLGKSPDIERGVTRIIHQRASPAEFVAVISAVLSSAKHLQLLHLEEGDNSGSEIIIESSLLRMLILTASSSTLISHAAELLSLINVEAASKGDLVNLLISSDCQFPEVYLAHKSVQLAEERLNQLIALFRKQLGIYNLEFMNVSGSTHLIELASDMKVPSNWVKVNSTKKTIRYHPPEVLKGLDSLLLAKEELALVCRSTWIQFLVESGKYFSELRAAVQALAALDCLHSLAILARTRNYVRPVILDENDDEPRQITICSGRHPVLELILQDSFVPNDTNLRACGEYCQIITGPNMGGKSCYIRQVACIALMAQVGSFIPASSAKIHVLDAIHTRMGSADSIQQGRSTFFEELSEAANLIHKSTQRSLVIIDELGRGTSTHDGVAIAYATLHYLLKQKRCMVLFVTHFPEIMDILKDFPSSAGFYHVSFLTFQKPLTITDKESSLEADICAWDDAKVTFLYKVVSGVSDKSYGLNVAQIAQIPPSCIARATTMAAKLEAEVSSRPQHRLSLKHYPERSLCSVANQGLGECTNSHEMLNGRLRNCCYNDLEELAALYDQLFLQLKSIFSDLDDVNVITSLKNAWRLATKLLQGNA